MSVYIPQEVIVSEKTISVLLFLPTSRGYRYLPGKSFEWDISCLMSSPCGAGSYKMSFAVGKWSFKCVWPTSELRKTEAGIREPIGIARRNSGCGLVRTFQMQASPDLWLIDVQQPTACRWKPKMGFRKGESWVYTGWIFKFDLRILVKIRRTQLQNTTIYPSHWTSRSIIATYHQMSIFPLFLFPTAWKSFPVRYNPRL